VIGGIAVLALIGIFVLLYLRHRGPRNKETPPETFELVGGEEKERHNGDVSMSKPELATGANTWELQGSGFQGEGNRHGGSGPWELPGHAEHLMSQKASGSR
jgi:hypothetical protein